MFEFHNADYEKQLMRLLARRDKNGLIINNPAQSMFLFVDRQHLDVNILSIFIYIIWVTATYEIISDGFCQDIS